MAIEGRIAKAGTAATPHALLIWKSERGGGRKLFSRREILPLLIRTISLTNDLDQISGSPDQDNIFY